MSPHEKIMTTILNCSIPTYYKRKRANNYAINLLEKYFSDEELDEFINNGTIERQESTKNLTMDQIQDFFEREVSTSEIIVLKLSQFEFKSLLYFRFVLEEYIKQEDLVNNFSDLKLFIEKYFKVPIKISKLDFTTPLDKKSFLFDVQLYLNDQDIEQIFINSDDSLTLVSQLIKKKEPMMRKLF